MTGIGHNSSPAGLAEALRAEDGEEIVFHYVQWHVNDYIAGTMGMPLEIEGAYQRFLMRLYQRGKPLPDDDRFMSTAMSVSLRIWKRIKEALVTLGKIIVKAGCLTNGRFEQERQKRAEEMRKRSAAAQARWAKAAKSGETSPKFEPSLPETSAKLPANVGKKVNKINDAPTEVHMLTNNQNPITNNQDNDTVQARASEPVKFDRSPQSLDSLQNRLLEACNGAASPAACPGLLSMAEPIRWIEGGCDLELDVIPTIKARAHGVKKGSVRSWSYFTQAVADAKATRERPMPAGEAKAPRIDFDEERRRREREANAARQAKIYSTVL